MVKVSSPSRDLGLSTSEPPARRTRKTQAERTADARAALIDAAIVVLHRHGYAGATMAAIAAEAGVSRTLITHHYGTLTQLMAEVVSVVYVREHEQYQRLEISGHRGTMLADWPELLWEVLSKPSGVAVLEILQAARSHPDLAEVVGPMQLRIEEQAVAGMHSRFGVGREASETMAGMRLLIWAIRGLSIAQILVADPEEIRRCVTFLKSMVEAAVMTGALPGGKPTVDRD